MHGLELRRAILQRVSEHQGGDDPTPLPQEELAKRLGVDADRMEAHLTFLERGGLIQSLHVPDQQGHRMRFLTITPSGEKYLKNPKNFETLKGLDSPFKVVQKGDEKVLTDFPAIIAMVERTEWVLDEEKPEILAKLDELEKVLDQDVFDPAGVGQLKIYFERHRWLAPHVTAVVKKRFGF